MEKYSIQGVEIFSVGTWNGDEYTQDDLNGMVAAFNENKDTLPPYLKLGHDDDQKLLQKDGYPAAGWIERLYMRGDKLVADFCDIPKKIFQAISNKAYRKVSAEIYWKLKVKDKVYPKFLGAVSLLGADMPAVTNLADILSQYKLLTEDAPKAYQLSFEYKEQKQTRSSRMEKTKEELALELELKKSQDAQEAEKKQYALDLKAKDDEIAAFKKEKEAAQVKELALIAEANKAKIEKFTSELIADKLCTPAMKPLVEAILGEDKKEYSIKLKDEEKKLSKEDLLKETLKLYKAASEVNFVESSEEGDASKKSDSKELDEKIKKHASEHKLTYGQAAKAVLAKQTK